MRLVAAVLAWIVGLYFVGRAIAELLLIDYGNPASYQADWGGPSLLGVLAVHAGPGVIAAALMIGYLIRRRGRTPGAVRGSTSSAP